MELRHVVLVEEPVCMICQRKPSVEVDHIIPICKNGTDQRDNMQGVCKACHEDKTCKDLGIRKPVTIGMDGYPIIK
jgi:5-methylcytosine-specific restriction protein A